MWLRSYRPSKGHFFEKIPKTFCVLNHCTQITTDTEPKMQHKKCLGARLLNELYLVQKHIVVVKL